MSYTVPKWNLELIWNVLELTGKIAYSIQALREKALLGSGFHAVALFLLARLERNKGQRNNIDLNCLDYNFLSEIDS